MSSKVKTVGLMLHEIDDLTIEGNGATLMYHGKMTTIALEHCNGVRINNLHIDFERPAGSEIQYRKVTGGETEVTLHRDTRYEIVNGKIRLYGEGWRSNKNHCIEYDPDTESFTYSQGGIHCRHPMPERLLRASSASIPRRNLCPKQETH